MGPLCQNGRCIPDLGSNSLYFLTFCCQNLQKFGVLGSFSIEGMQKSYICSPFPGVQFTFQGPEASKKLARGSQKYPKAFRGFAKASQRLPRSFQRFPRSLPEASRSLRKASQRLPEASKKLPKSHQKLPRGF